MLWKEKYKIKTIAEKVGNYRTMWKKRKEERKLLPSTPKKKSGRPKLLDYKLKKKIIKAVE